MVKSPKEVLRYLEGKMKQNPDSILFARLADTYLSMNRIEDAIHMCEEGIKKHPQYVTGHFILSKCYLYKRQYDQAQKELKRVLYFDPHYIAAHRDYGELMRTMGWESSAESSYEKILEADPLNLSARAICDEIKNKYHIETKKADDHDEIELGEFEEENRIAGEVKEHSERDKDAIDEFEEAFSEKSKSPRPVTDEEEDKYTYILDDIFRDDAISAEKENEKPVIDFTPKVSETTFAEKQELKESQNFTKDAEPANNDFFDKWLENSTHVEHPPLKLEDIEEEIKELPKKKSHIRKEKIVTPTLGEIYIAQHQYAKAIGVYEILKKVNPENEIYEKKIEFLKRKLAENQDSEK